MDEDILPHLKKGINIAVINLLLALACPEVSVIMQKWKLISRFNLVKKTFLEKYIATPKTDGEVIFTCFSMVSKRFQCTYSYWMAQELKEKLKAADKRITELEKIRNSTKR